MWFGLKYHQEKRLMDVNIYRESLKWGNSPNIMCRMHAVCVCVHACLLLLHEGKFMQLRTGRWLILLCSNVFW